MRILHIDSGKQMGGGQWQVLRLIEGLEAAGVESTLLARPGAPLFDAARKRGLRVEALGLRRVAALSRPHDLTHAHDARGHTLGVIAGAARLIVSRRVAFPVRSRWKYRRALRYLAVSEYVKSILMAGGVPAEKIDVVHDGVPLLPVKPGEGVLAAAKGKALAMEAARLAGVGLTVATDLEYELPGAAIFVYLTECEGLGSAALLAMSAGAAVIASKVGGLTEAIRHGENGLLVENRAEAVAAAIRQLRDDSGLARRLGEAGRRTIQEQFTIGHLLRRTIEVYRQVLK
jgi:glycosyltransferase involved in cell wall biosynthesis